MILSAEAEKIKYCSSPRRLRKYILVAFAQLLAQYGNTFDPETVKTLVAALAELGSKKEG
jgi:response regulator RpfG family c-di-GMP phosphodiesterase